MDEQFMQDVLNIVDIIPMGRVATYGQIARLIGRPRNARLVGKALGKSGHYGKHPCHRVVTATGRLVPGWIDQRPMLVAENIPFKDENHVAIQQCLWKGI
ncbi:MGMT family protein [uncultured Limosilactobacillus sp.]|uniref:MGMT family protein n=1 Tax=uncultured Limosilactobacillus sp. TaxID=2837629 RepID=UPI0025D799A1|nr:methylated-DNA--[protein]-cysteine S-methyltransferase [uncultured Limosilactobacillus sp.]